MKLSIHLLILPLIPAALAQTYKASFTQYGAGDANGSPNCNTATAACGFYNYPGYNAAVSQVCPVAPPSSQLLLLTHSFPLDHQ